MTRSRASRPGRRPLAALAAGIALLVPGLAGPPAAAASGTAAILELTGVQPPIVSPNTPVVLTGQLRAPQGQSLTDPTVRVLLGRRAMITRNDVAAWVADQVPVEATTTLTSTRLPGVVPPGGTVAFSVTVPPERIQLTRPFGAIPIGLEVSDAGGAAREVVRTFIGWQAQKRYEPVRLAWVAPLTLDPDVGLFASDAAVRAAAWTRAVGPGSRIDRILTGTRDAPVTYAVDPTLLDGAALAPAQAGTEPGAAALARRLAQAGGAAPAAAGSPVAHPLWALPYADVDLAAAADAGAPSAMVRDLVRRAAQVTDTLGVAARTDIAWPADGGLQGSREEAVRALFGGTGPAGLLVAASSLPNESGYSTTADQKGPRGTPLLAWDDRLSSLMLRTGTPAAGTLMAQEFIAETATLVGELPGRSRSFVIAIPRTVDPDAAALQSYFSVVARTPWVVPTQADDVLAASAAASPQSRSGAGSWTHAGTARLDGPTLAGLEAQRATVAKVAKILPRGAELVAQWQDAVDQLTSARWRTSPDAWRTLSTEAVRATSRATDGIAVTPQTTNFFADEGFLQVTVVNDLNDPVEGVRLVLAPTNPRIRITSQAPPVRIEARSRATVQVRVAAVAAGLVPINAWLTTADGTRIGRDAVLEVRTNPPGRWLYLVMGGIAALVLVAGLVRTLRPLLRDNPAGTP